MNVRAQRWSMGAGIAFAVLAFVGLNVQESGLPDYDGSKDSPAVIAQKVHKALADSGNRMEVLVGAYLLVAASLLLVWFSYGLRERLAAASPERTLAPSLVSAFGILAAVGLSGGALLDATVPGSITFGSDPVPPQSAGDGVRFLTEVGIPMIVVVFALAMAAMIATLSVCALQGRGLPRWQGYVGGLGVLGGIFGVIFLPLVLIVLWALVVGVAGLRVAPTTSAAAPRAGAAVA